MKTALIALLSLAPLCAEAAAQSNPGSIYDARRGPVMTHGI